MHSAPVGIQWVSKESALLATFPLGAKQFNPLPVGANSSKKGHFIETLEGTYFSTVNDL
jgi:hypothetical protein